MSGISNRKKSVHFVSEVYTRLCFLVCLFTGLFVIGAWGQHTHSEKRLYRHSLELFFGGIYRTHLPPSFEYVSGTPVSGDIVAGLGWNRKKHQWALYTGSQWKTSMVDLFIPDSGYNYRAVYKRNAWIIGGRYTRLIFDWKTSKLSLFADLRASFQTQLTKSIEAGNYTKVRNGLAVNYSSFILGINYRYLLNYRLGFYFQSFFEIASGNYLRPYVFDDNTPYAVEKKMFGFEIGFCVGLSKKEKEG